MSLDPTAQFPSVPVVIQGEDKTLGIRLKSSTSGDPYDLTAATEIEAVFLKTDNTCLHKKLTTGGIVLVSGPGGYFQVLLTDTETPLLALSPVAGYSSIEIRVTIGGKVNYVQLVDSMQVVASLFPNC